MIPYVDVRCQEWARQVLGGLPRCTQISVLDDRVRSYCDMGDDAYEIERIICKMLDPWKRVVKTHYLHPGNVAERHQSLRMSYKQYRKILNEAHDLIHRRLSENFQKNISHGY